MMLKMIITIIIIINISILGFTNNNIGFLDNASFPQNFWPDSTKTLNQKLKNLQSFHIIIPQVFVTGRKDDVIKDPIWLNGSLSPELTIEIGDYTLIVHKTHNRNGRSRNMNSRMASSCIYRGEVQGMRSCAVVELCYGISGHIVIDSLDAFHVAPLYLGQKDPFKVEHAIFRHREVVCAFGPKCALKHSMGQRKRKKWRGQQRIRRNPKSPLGEPYDSTAATMYLELYVVNDHSQYLKFNRDYWKVVRRTKEIVNIINSIYRQIGIYIVLVGLEVWTEKDEIPVLGNSSETMQSFVEYKKRNISRRTKHDNAQLIVGKELGQGVIGKAPIRTMCSLESSAAVNEDRHINAAAVATTIAHEMGHNFGLSHDLTSCLCPDKQCIMSSAGGGSENFKYWSDCSKEKFDEVFKKGMDYCMHDLPDETSMGPTCGNGFQEGDEECDCGLEEDCDNPCCLAISCKLAPNATCATGKCCDLETCQMRTEGSECRPPSSQCDLPEYCDGLREFCPSDVYKQNGFPCDVGGEGAYCFNGKCQTHNSQCIKLWGHTGRMSDSLCYEHFNVMGNVHGHCGYNWLDRSFVECAPRDVMCGMLHCEHEAKDLSYWFSSMTLTMPDTFLIKNEGKIVCKAAIMDVGFMPDPGQVADGTKCAPQSMCLNSRCINISYLNFPRCPDSCNSNGVCNSLGQCHCNAGWAPPFCKSRGRGGSSHSGIPGDRNLPTLTVVLICFVCFLIIPTIIISTAIIWIKRKRVKEMSIKKWSQCYSFAERSISSRLKPSRNPGIVTFAENSECISNNKKAKTSNVAQHLTHKQSFNLSRASSFRPEDISRPLLQSSTNNKLIVSNQNNPSDHTSKPQRPKPPTVLRSTNSLTNKKHLREQIYANQIVTNISIDLESQKTDTNIVNTSKEIEDTEVSKIIPDLNGMQPKKPNESGGVFKQNYVNVDDISVKHKSFKLIGELNEPKTSDWPKKERNACESFSTHMKQSGQPESSSHSLKSASRVNENIQTNSIAFRGEVSTLRVKEGKSCLSRDSALKPIYANLKT